MLRTSIVSLRYSYAPITILRRTHAYHLLRYEFRFVACFSSLYTLDCIAALKIYSITYFSKLLCILYDAIFEFCHLWSYMLPRPFGFDELLMSINIGKCCMHWWV